MASGGGVLSPIAMNTPAKAPKLLAYELQIDQARCQGSWGLIRDRLAGKHEKYSGKGVFRDFLIAEAALGDKFATFLKEHPDYDAIPTIVPRAADPKEFAKIRDSLLRVIEKSGSSGLLNLNFNLPGLKPSRSVPADTPAPAEPVIASGPVGGLPTISVRAPTEATGTARTTIEPPMPLDLVRQAHILLAKIDLLAKGDADAALTALGIANLPEDLPDTVSIATDGWTNGMKVLVAQGWVLRGLAYHLKSDFVSAFQCFDRVISWYCQKISPTAAALDPANASANGRALRTLTNASIGSLAAASADERSQPIPMVDIGTGTDQWAYWAEEASWRKTVQMIFKLGAASFPDGFYRDDDTQTTVTLHLNMFPPPSTKSGVKAKMLMRSRYVVPLRERIKYLITSMGGFAEQGTPSSLAGRTGKPSPVYGLSNGGRIRPNPNVMMNRVGTWEIEAQTLLASYEECVTGIHEFPKAIRDDREEARYKRVKECFEWMSMVCWESTDGDADEEEDERATWVPEIEKWRRGWLSVEENYRSMYHSFNHLPFFRSLIHSFGYLATNFPDSFTSADRKEVLGMIETYLQLWVDGCKKELVEAEKRLEDEKMLKGEGILSQSRKPSAEALASTPPSGSKAGRTSAELPGELSAKFAEEVWNSTIRAQHSGDDGLDSEQPSVKGTPPRDASPSSSARTRESILEAAAARRPGFHIPPDLGKAPPGSSDAAEKNTEQEQEEEGDERLYEAEVPLTWWIPGSGETLPCYLGVLWDAVRMFASGTTFGGTINQDDAELYDWVLDLARKAVIHVQKARPHAPNQRDYETCEAEARWILGVALCEWSSSRCTVDPDAREKAFDTGLEELALAAKLLDGEAREWECLFTQAQARCSAGQVDIAIALLRRCLQLQPTSIPVWHLLVLALSSSPAKVADGPDKRSPSAIPEAWTLAETAWKELVVEGDSWSLVSTSRKVELMKLRCSAMWILRAFKGPTKALEECRQLLSLFAKMFPSVMRTDAYTVNTLLRATKKLEESGFGAATAERSEASSAVLSPSAAVASLAGSAVPQPATPTWLDKDTTKASVAAEGSQADGGESIHMQPLANGGASISPGFARTVSMSSVSTSAGAFGPGSSSASLAFPSSASFAMPPQRLAAIPFVPDHMTNTYQFAPYDILLHLWLASSFLYRDLKMPEQAFAALEEAFKVVTDIQRREIRREDGPSTLNLLTGIVDVRGEPVRSKEEAATPLLKKRGWRYDMAPRRVRRCIVDVEVEWCLTELLRRVKELEAGYAEPDPFRKYKTATDIVEEDLRTQPRHPPAPMGFNIESLHDGPAKERLQRMFSNWDLGKSGNVNAALKLPFPDPFAPPPNDPTLADLADHLHSLSLVADHHTPLRTLLGRLYFYKRQAAESEYWLYRATQDEQMLSAAVSGECSALGGNWWGYESWMWDGRILAEVGQMKLAYPALLRAGKLEKGKPVREWRVVGRLI